MCYYPAFFPWFLSYFFDSFKSPFPWEKETEIEGIAWNTKYFRKDVLQVSAGIDEPLRFIPWLVLMLLISYIIIFLIVRKGLKSASNVVYYTVPIPFFLMILLIAKGLTLKGSLIGITAFLKPDWTVLWDIKTWETAYIQCIFQTGLTNGLIMHLGSTRQP